MSMIIKISANQEAKINHIAARHGVTPLTYAQHLLDEALEREDESERVAQREKNQGSIALLQGWIDEADAMTDDEKA